MSESRSKYLIKNTAIFALGNFAPKIISFFLVPLYTIVLSTNEYGTVDLIATICTIAVPVLTMNIMEAVMRFSLDKGADRDKITKIGIIILFCGMLLGLIIIPVCNIFERMSSIGVLVYFYVVCAASAQVFLYILRGKEQLMYYSIGNVINTFLIAAFNILFLLVFKMGIEGYLLAFTLANAIVAVYALIVGKGYRSFASALDFSMMKQMLKYSVLLIPNSLMWWIMNSSDHIMVTSMISVAANGIYAISYKLPSLVSIITTVFNQAWSYSAIREEGSKDEEEYNNDVLKKLTCIVVLIGLLILVFAKPFLKVYVASEYYSSWKYISFLTVGLVYATLATFMATSYTVHKDSAGYLCSATFGALLNVAMNFMLIPHFGIYGAALATCISYIAVFIFRLFHTRKYLHYNLINIEFILGTIILIVVALLMYVDNIYGFVLQLSLLAFLVIMYAKVLMPIIRDAKDKLAKWRFLRKR